VWDLVLSARKLPRRLVLTTSSYSALVNSCSGFYGWITGVGAAPWVKAIPPAAPARAAAPALTRPALTAPVVSSRLRL
jgi:uncharacterized membrane protein YfcA